MHPTSGPVGLTCQVWGRGRGREGGTEGECWGDEGSGEEGWGGGGGGGGGGRGEGRLLGIVAISCAL